MVAISAHIRPRSLATAGVLALLSTGMVASSATSAASAPEGNHQGAQSSALQPSYDGIFGQFNMWGSVGHWGETEGLVESIGASVRSREPVALALQEVCENQIEALAADLKGYDYVFEPAWDEPRATEDPGNENRRPTECRGIPGEGDDAALQPRYGNAVLFREGLGFATDDGKVGRYDLGTFHGDNPEYRTMVCTSSTELNTAVCSAHLSAGSGKYENANRTIETRNVAYYANAFFGDHSLIIGADLNTEPDDELTDLLYHEDYHDGSTGQYRELMSDCLNQMSPYCKRGDPTLGAVDSDTHQRSGDPGRKFDYLFASTNVEEENWAVTQPSENCPNPVYENEYLDADDAELAQWETMSCSDHEMLWATVHVAGT